MNNSIISTSNRCYNYDYTYIVKNDFIIFIQLIILLCLLYKIIIDNYQNKNSDELHIDNKETDNKYDTIIEKLQNDNKETDNKYNTLLEKFHYYNNEMNNKYVNILSNDEKYFIELYIINCKCSIENVLPDYYKNRINIILRHFNLHMNDIYKLIIGYSFTFDYIIEDLYTYTIVFNKDNNLLYQNYIFNTSPQDGKKLIKYNENRERYNKHYYGKYHAKKILNIDYNILLIYPRFNGNLHVKDFNLFKDKNDIIDIDDIRKTEIQIIKLNVTDNEFYKTMNNINSDKIIDSIY